MIRSILSVPGHRLDMAEKARSRGADQVAWDLEDSVPVAMKAVALRNVIASALPGDAVRIHADVDLRHLDRLLPADVMFNLPKIERARDVAAFRKFKRPLLAIIESPRAVRNADEICTVSDAVAFGRADFRAAAGLSSPEARLIEYAMAEIAMASLAAGIPAYDSPCETLRSQAEMFFEVARARDLGFSGKICIHPSQLPACALFSSYPDRRLVGLQGTGAREVDGRVYAEPHFKLAERLAGGLR